MDKHSKQIRMMVTVDCMIFGFDGTKLKKLFFKIRLIREKGI